MCNFYFLNYSKFYAEIHQFFTIYTVVNILYKNSSIKHDRIIVSYDSVQLDSLQ